MYPHFNIYPSVQGDRVDRSYAPSVPETPVIQTEERTSSASSSALNVESPQADRMGYPVLNICMSFPSSAIRAPSQYYPYMTRRSNHHDLDPAVYPHFEICPKVQTVQSRPKINSGDGGRRLESYIHSGPKEDLGGQTWSFVWPWFQPDSSPVPTLSSVPALTPSPAPKSMMAYPVINIREFPTVWASGLFTNYGTHRPRSLSVLRPVSQSGTSHSCSTFQTNPAAEVFGRHQGEVGGNESQLPGNEDM